MKVFLALALFICASFSSFAQTAECPVPEHFRNVVALMNKPIADVLIGFSQSSLKYQAIFRGDSDNPEWIFINFFDEKQQVCFVFINGKSQLALLSGNPCSCIGEFEYLMKNWVRQGNQARYINKEDTIEAIIDADGDGGCMSLKMLK
ncbi:hypothetical protein [Hymenobacter rubidus]|uniref:hypothetical protein n=1 Tax=Hymenobacter rubidus TaxID=1441626 RepID=UPI00191E2812|nr:hypothetical protein [Hymenobacter rubidus]